MKRDLPVILIMLLGLATAVLFCMGMVVESVVCCIVALGLTIVWVK